MSASASRARELLLELDADLLKRSVITPDFEKKEVAPPINQSRFALQKLRKVSWQQYSAVWDTVVGIEQLYMRYWKWDWKQPNSQ